MYCVGAKPLNIIKKLSDPKCWIVVSQNAKWRAVWEPLVSHTCAYANIPDSATHVIFYQLPNDVLKISALLKLKKWIIVNSKPNQNLIKNLPKPFRILVQRTKSQNVLVSYFNAFHPCDTLSEFSEIMKTSTQSLIIISQKEESKDQEIKENITKLISNEVTTISIDVYPQKNVDIDGMFKSMLSQHSTIAAMLKNHNFEKFPNFTTIKFQVNNDRVDLFRSFIWSFLDALKARNHMTKAIILV